MLQSTLRQSHPPLVLPFKAAPRRLSQRVAWLLGHRELESLLDPGNRFFPDFMDQLGTTLERAFRGGDHRALFEVHQARSDELV